MGNIGVGQYGGSDTESVISVILLSLQLEIKNF